MLKLFLHLNCLNSIHFGSAKTISICVVRTGANEIDFLIGISRVLVCMYVVAVFLAVAFISHEEVKSMIYLFLKNVCAKGMRNEIYTIWTERD